MATLTGAKDRGQLLIVASVAFTVVLIALALALNTAVYSDVHVAQTDSGSFEERSALQYEDSAQRGVATLLPLTAEDTSLENKLQREAELWENLTRVQLARDGVATNISVEKGEVQNRIVHDNESRVFGNKEGNASWTVVESVTDEVVYQMTIQNDSLKKLDNGTDVFTLEVTGGNGSSWSLSAFTTNESEIVVEINGTRQYETNQSSLQIDIANGIFNETGDREEFVSFVEDVDVASPYDIEYSNADNVTGTYYLFEGTLEDGKKNLTYDDNNYKDEGSPRVTEQIGSATVTVNYRSPELRYRNTVEAVAGVYDE